MIRRLELAIAGCILLTIAAIVAIVGFSQGPFGSGASTALADVGEPTTIDVSHSGSTVTASGTWTWEDKKGKPKCSEKKSVGFAIDWGDGSDLEMKWAGPNPATDVTMATPQPASNCDGNWGEDSHDYAEPGTFDICVVIYDISVDKNTGLPKEATGNHSIDPATNTDSSDEEETTICTQITLQLTITLVPPTATNTVGEEHTVTATVGIEGTPVGEGYADVEFEITNGPNDGDDDDPNFPDGTDTTDANGEATFEYTGDGGAGTDTIQACVVDYPEVCATAKKTWEEPPSPTPTPTPTPAPTATPAPTPTPAPTATPTPTPAPATAVLGETQAPETLPVTGGPPAGGSTSDLSLLLGLGGLALVSGAATIAVARRRHQ